MTPLISVITPCYNHGRYLDDACKSVLTAGNKNVFEHIIVNDGSTDPDTLSKLQELECKGYQVIHQENRGLAQARNAGLKAARGTYILPLDSDNKIFPEVTLRASAILESRKDIDVVYTDAYWFGETEMEVKTSEFDLLKILYNNYIDACALIRKETLATLGGYDAEMPFMGHEDWELWVNIAIHGGGFYYLHETGYHYRVVKNFYGTNGYS